MSSPMEKKNDFGSCEFQENLDILRQISFFSGLPLEHLKIFAFICQREKFKPGDYLFRQDDDDGQAFYIISGSVRLVYKSEAGEEEIRRFQAGQFLGGMVLLGKSQRLFSMQAVTETWTLVVPREKFQSALQQFPDALPKFLKAVVNGITDWEDHFLKNIGATCDECKRHFGVSLV